DSAGNLVAAQFLKPADFNADPESCVVDAAGNIYVGQPDGNHDIVKFNSAGTKLDSLDVATEDRGSDWVDLASDQCTLLYPSEGSKVLRYNACTHTQLPDFATGLPAACYAHRLRANGEVLVACDHAVVRLSPTGTVLNTFTDTSLLGKSGLLFA